ncbi:hypothetical protein CRUP_013952 [Coryphaenoides rupestris]|nr:hypothetical protein CRUP_013952 [Coryphaenoides rupestris]
MSVVVGPEAGPQTIRAWGPGLENGIVGFAIEGPSQAKIECADQNDGSCDVLYWPTEPGEYAVHVTCDEQDIEHSPFMALIAPDDQASHASKDAEGVPVEVQVRSKGGGVYSCSYSPSSALKHTLALTWGACSIPRSPFRVAVGRGSHPGQVKVFGPGVEPTGLKANEPTHFTVDCTGAGEGSAYTHTHTHTRTHTRMTEEEFRY